MKMNKRKIMILRVLLSALASLMLLLIPVGAFFMNSGNSIAALAEESVKSVSGGSTSDDSTSDDSISDDDTPSQNEIEPLVKITVTPPSGWYKKKATVKVSVTDMNNSGKFFAAKAEAKMGEGNSYEDITDAMKFTIYEDGPVYVQITDTNGRTYSKSVYIECFDTVSPTLNASVTSDLLTVKATDSDSGVKAIYINGTEFTDLTDGTLAVRLQQFDASYQNFVIQAMDNAGNISDAYSVKNPYYTDPASITDDQTKKAAQELVQQLPVSAQSTPATQATGTVTQHSDEKETVSGDGAAEDETGREIYTIVTKSSKTFYMVIDHSQDSDNALLLTPVCDNDLMNYTAEEDADTLPQNAAVSINGLPETTVISDTDKGKAAEKAAVVSADTATAVQQSKPQKKSGGKGILILAGAAAVFMAAYYFLKIKGGKEKKEYNDEDGYADNMNALENETYGTDDEDGVYNENDGPDEPAESEDHDGE